MSVKNGRVDHEREVITRYSYSLQRFCDHNKSIMLMLPAVVATVSSIAWNYNYIDH